MSYSQVAQNCGFSEPTAKRIAKKIVGPWLEVKVKLGRLTQYGRENLYHGLVPQDVENKLRDKLRESVGVSLRHPVSVTGYQGDTPSGYHSDTPSASRGIKQTPTGYQADPTGYQGDTITSLSLSEEREATRYHSDTSQPHFNGVGLVISGRHDIITTEVVGELQAEFPHIADVMKPKLVKLATVIVARGIGHPGWTSPLWWMRGCLADDNKKAATEGKINDARLAKAKAGGPGSGKTFSR
jgi:hypothetical protein